MKLDTLSQKQLLKRCAWCHKVIPSDQERFGGGARVWPSAKPVVAAHEGKAAPLSLSTGRQIIAIVPTADSEARAAGHDIFFQACSEECCVAVTSAIRADLGGPN
jgi:hypothetical protein